MKLRFKDLFLAVAIAVALNTTASAQMTLTVEQAVEMALSENPTIKVAELEIERYDYVRKTTMGALLPQVSVSGEYNRTIQNQSMAEGFSLGKEQYNTFTASGNISLALYAPTVYRTLKMNRIEAEAAVESARASKIDLVAQVKQSFYSILLAEQTLRVLESSLETAKQTVEETEVKYKNGLAAEYDLLSAQVQQSNLEPTIIQTRSSIAVAKDLLKMYLSIPLDVDVAVKGDLHEFKEEVLSSFANISRDISGNSSIKSLDIQSEVLKQTLKVYNASRLPTLAAFGIVSHTGNNMGSFSFDTTATTSSDDSYFWQTPAYAGLTLSVPLFAGLTNTNRARQISNQITQLELQRNYAVKGVEVDINRSISDLISSREQMFAQQTTVDQATKAYKIAETRYSAGAGTILELNTSRLAMTQAELNLTQAIYDFLVARSDYDKIIGTER